MHASLSLSVRIFRFLIRVIFVEIVKRFLITHVWSFCMLFSFLAKLPLRGCHVIKFITHKG